MVHTINQKFEITKRPPLHLMMASLMGNHDDWLNLPFVTFTTTRPLETDFGEYKPRHTLKSRILIKSLSRDQFMREIVFDGSFLSQLGPGVNIAGSIILNNSRPSYLWFVNETGLQVYANHGARHVFPQLSNEEQTRVMRGQEDGRFDEIMWGAEG